MSNRAQLGESGEQLVAEHLEQQGFEVLARNVRVGRLELDLVARRNDLVVICEVRTRATRSYVDPILTIDRAKQERVRRAARGWVARHGMARYQVRLDAASVVLNDLEADLTYYEAAF